MSEPSRPGRKSLSAADRRPLRFWEPFNIWWREELERTGRRASADDINKWYQAQSAHAWGPERPSLQETRTHAKCLRSVSSVRDYFREYRAKKKHEQSEMEMDEEEDDRRSRSTASRRAPGSRSKAARSNSTAACADFSRPMYSHLANSNEQGYWGSGYYDGTASGITTAAATGAGNDYEQATHTMAGYEQQVAAFEQCTYHPGPLDAVWASYQLPSTAVTTQGPLLPQRQASQAPSKQLPYQDQGDAGAASPAAQWQKPLGTSAGTAAADAAEAQLDHLRGASQQQEHQQEQGQQQPQGPGHNRRGGRVAGRVSWSSMHSPGQQQLAAGVSYHLEVPAISPRGRHDLRQGGTTSWGAASAVQQMQAAYASMGMTQEGFAAVPGLTFDQQAAGHSQAAAAAAAAAATSLQPDTAGSAQQAADVWSMTRQLYAAQQHQPAHSQGYWMAATAAAASALDSSTQAAAMHQQQQMFLEQMPSWLQLQLQQQQQQQAQGQSGPASLARAACSTQQDAVAAVTAKSEPTLQCKAGDAGCAGATAPGAGHSSRDLPTGTAGVAHAGLNAAPLVASSQPDLAATVPLGLQPCSHLEAPRVPGAAAAVEATASTPHGVIPASLLAAVPLPGCTGHTDVDRVLLQLEARPSCQGLGHSLHDGHAAEQQQLPYPRMSISALLDAPGLLSHCGAAARRLSQSLDHLSMPYQRLSLHAMNSGVLDLLAEGMDLDTFLGTNDLAAAAAAAGEAAAAVPPAGGSDDFIAPVAPGSRPSFRLLRASCHLPEHWQQHLLALQDAPFRHGPGQGRAVSMGTGPQGSAAQAAAAAFSLGRASSAGMDALAEAAAAALAAQPELMAGPSSALAPATLAESDPQRRASPGPALTAVQELPSTPAVGDGAAAEGQEAVQGSGPGRKRGRPAASMGPPGPTAKRACHCAELEVAPVVAADAADEQAAPAAAAADVGRSFKYVLDLATPKGQPAALQPTQQPQGEEQHPSQDPQACATQRVPVVLDLRPEDLGATSENTLNTPHPAAFQPPQHGSGATGLPAGAAPGISARRSQLLLLPPLLSPGRAAAGCAARGGAVAGALHCGPATAASTTGAPPRGPSGAVLPAPAMAHMAMAAAMAAAAATVRPPAVLGAQALVAGYASRPLVGGDTGKQVLPAMHEIERMI